MTPDNAAHFLYRCYDIDGDLIYVGCTKNVRRRIASHLRGSSTAVASRWLRVFMDRYEVEGPFDGREAGREAEWQAIQAEEPLFNFQGRNGAGMTAGMTRQPVALYLIERGHIQLAVETTCACWSEVLEAGHFDGMLCVAHKAAHQAGLTDLTPVAHDWWGAVA